jgi:hypothetical protein
MADKAYWSAANRAYLRKRGIQAVIPVKEDQKKHRRARGRTGGRPPAFDPGHYKERNTVEMSKPQCCHSCGLSALPLTPSPVVVVVVACWLFSQGRRRCCPRGVWWSARRRSTSAGPACTTVRLMAGCR